MYLLLCASPKSLYNHIVNQTREYIQPRRYSQGVAKMCSQPDFSPAYPLRYPSSSAGTSWRETGAQKEQPVIKAQQLQKAGTVSHGRSLNSSSKASTCEIDHSTVTIMQEPPMQVWDRQNNKKIKTHKECFRTRPSFFTLCKL